MALFSRRRTHNILASCWFALVLAPISIACRASHTAASAELRATIERTPTLPFRETHFQVRPQKPGWRLGAVSGVASDNHGTIYVMQRGAEAPPIIAVDEAGKVLRSWGTGDFALPHNLRVDRVRHLWAIDSGASKLIEYASTGQRLLTIDIGQTPAKGGLFRGATDVSFGADGFMYVTDGYSNARVLVYTPGGRRVGEWGQPGEAVGDFKLPHSIQNDEHGHVYVADRENGRIEVFSEHGLFVAQIPHVGRCYSLRLADGALWATVSPLDEDTGAPGWVLKLDPQSGKILGHLDVPDGQQGHEIEVLSSGEPIVTAGSGLIWFRTQSIAKAHS